MPRVAALALACALAAALGGCGGDGDDGGDGGGAHGLPAAPGFELTRSLRLGPRPRPAPPARAPDILALAGVGTRVVGISLPSGRRRPLLDLGTAADPQTLALQGWSPDARSFAVTAGLGTGRPRIVVADLAGGRGRTLTPDVLDDRAYSATFSPDGRYLLIPSERGRGLFAYELASGRTVRVFRGPVASSFTPSWSPDGRRFAFTLRLTGGILVADLADRSMRVLTRDGYGPSWSPRDDRIAFTAARGPARHCGKRRCRRATDIDVVRADGTGRRRLTHTAAGESGPSWSPDGRWLVALRRPPGSNPNPRFDLVTFAADGSCYRVLPAPKGDSLGIGPNAWRPGARAAPRC
jgi:dipeptidyl aminopeptidase/acylaminoacyl peptidase